MAESPRSPFLFSCLIFCTFTCLVFCFKLHLKNLIVTCTLASSLFDHIKLFSYVVCFLPIMKSYIFSHIDFDMTIEQLASTSCSDLSYLSSFTDVPGLKRSR